MHIKVTGVVEYLGQDNEVTETVSATTQRALYLRWCEQHGRQPASPSAGNNRPTGTRGLPALAARAARKTGQRH